jgi:ATP-dependent Lon protease
MSIELDELDKLAASVFDGYLVRKDLVRKYSRQYPVPSYVVEFLLGRYCASVNESEIAEGLEIVEKQLKDRTVRTGEEELFKARAKETGSVKIIDILRAKLDAKNDCYVAELPSLNLRDEAVNKTVSGLTKLLFPDSEMPVPDEDLEWIVRVAFGVQAPCEGAAAARLQE